MWGMTTSTMARDTVSWDRKPNVPPTLDSEMNPVLTGHASGFPRNVVGRFQEIQREDRTTDGGADVRYHALFFSDSYVTGQVGDIVTFRGRPYSVSVARRRNQILVDTIRFVRYELKLVTLGEEQSANTD